MFNAIAFSTLTRIAGGFIPQPYGRGNSDELLIKKSPTAGTVRVWSIKTPIEKPQYANKSSRF